MESRRPGGVSRCPALLLVSWGGSGTGTPVLRAALWASFPFPSFPRASPPWPSPPPALGAGGMPAATPAHPGLPLEDSSAPFAHVAWRRRPDLRDGGGLTGPRQEAGTASWDRSLRPRPPQPPPHAGPGRWALGRLCRGFESPRPACPTGEGAKWGEILLAPQPGTWRGAPPTSSLGPPAALWGGGLL